MNLTGEEKAQLKALIDAGEPLPDTYRFRLFSEPREAELIWPGKSYEVTQAVLPFQTIEQIDEPRSEAGEQVADLFSVGASGRQAGGWSNKLIWGDNKLVLSSLKGGPLRKAIEDAGGLKLVYIDPPFDVGADFSFDVAVGGEQLLKEPSLIEDIAYRDTWGRGIDSYSQMIMERLRLIKSLLASDGAIFIHCDDKVNAQIRILCDEIFGRENYRNEISRIKCNPKNFTSSAFGYQHDTIIFYSASQDFNLYPLNVGRTSEEREKDFPQTDSSGRRYTTVALHAKGNRKGPTGEAWRGLRPPTGRHWAYIPETLDGFDAAGEIEWSSTGNPRLKRYADEDKGKAVQSVWEIKDPGDRSASYPTEKPEELLSRIIQSSTREGDLVADFFCGSGTTLAVAEKLGRKWIGADLGRFAIHTSRKRLIGMQRELKTAGQPYRAFEILNLGKYERQWFAGIDSSLTPDQRVRVGAAKELAYVELILRAYTAQPADQSPPFHGRKGDAFVLVGPVDAPVTEAAVSEAINAARAMNARAVDVLGFEFEMGLSPRLPDEARIKGVTLSLRQIPKEVFDKRAVDKGQVTFHELAFVEAKAEVVSKRDRSVSVSLTDFGVYYRQEDIEALMEGMKPGGSKVTVDQGQVVKVTRPKGGGEPVVERLTKEWTDWIDYWAVDFDYASRPETIHETINLPDGSVKHVPQWTGSYIFENEWQSFRTRRDRNLELTSATHVYPAPGRYRVAVKVIDIFGNDTTKVIGVEV